MRNKKGQTGGLITGIIFGIVTLVIGVIIAFVVIGTINDANLLEAHRPTSHALNEQDAWCNETGYTVVSENATTAGFAITGIYNASTEGGASNYNWSITGTTANCSVSDAGVVTNASTLTWDFVSLNYTFVSYTGEEMTVDRLVLNFSAGIDNVSEQIPTVLLVAAIVLILAVLAILVAVWQRMRLGGGGGTL